MLQPHNSLPGYLSSRSSFGLVVLLHKPVLTQDGDGKETGPTGRGAQRTPEAARKLCCLICCPQSGGWTLQTPASRSGCKGIPGSLRFAQVTRASLRLSLLHREKAVISQAPGTGIRLSMPPAVLPFPVAPLMSLPSCPTAHAGPADARPVAPWPGLTPLCPKNSLQ